MLKGTDSSYVLAAVEGNGGQQRGRFGDDARVRRFRPGTLGLKARLYSLSTKRNPKACLLGKQVAGGEDTLKQATDKPARELDKRYK